MKTRKWLVAFSLIMVLSMVLAACAPAATQAPAEPQVIEKTVVTTKEVEVVKTEVVVQTVEVFVTPTPPPTTRTGAWVDQVVFTSVDDANAAVSQIQAGELDIYAYTVDDPELYKTVQGDPNLTFTNAFGSSNEISYNPAACTDTTKLNPFANAKIREATNMLYDRNYVVQEVTGGLGAVKLLPIVWGFPDYTKFVGKSRELEAKYAFNPDKAKEVITAEMEGLGATLGADGKWQFNGAPVTVIGLIRTEDERKIIGDYVATQLESVGFTVDRQFKTRSEASPIWVQSDPAECLYNYYTGGWITTEVDRDAGDNFSFYYTANDYPIPMFQAYKPSPEFDEIALKLRNNDFNHGRARPDVPAGHGPGACRYRRWLGARLDQRLEILHSTDQQSPGGSRPGWGCGWLTPVALHRPLPGSGRRRDAHRPARHPGRSMEPDRWLQLDLRYDADPRYQRLGHDARSLHRVADTAARRNRYVGCPGRPADHQDPGLD